MIVHTSYINSHATQSSPPQRVNLSANCSVTFLNMKSKGSKPKQYLPVCSRCGKQCKKMSYKKSVGLCSVCYATDWKNRQLAFRWFWAHYIEGEPLSKWYNLRKRRRENVDENKLDPFRIKERRTSMPTMQQTISNTQKTQEPRTLWPLQSKRQCQTQQPKIQTKNEGT